MRRLRGVRCTGAKSTESRETRFIFFLNRVSLLLSAGRGLMEAVRHLPSILCTSARSMTFTGPWLSAMEYALAASSMYTARV